MFPGHGGGVRGSPAHRQEPQPQADLLHEDFRTHLLPGGPQPRDHDHLDRRSLHGGGRLSAVLFVMGPFGPFMSTTHEYLDRRSLHGGGRLSAVLFVMGPFGPFMSTTHDYLDRRSAFLHGGGRLSAVLFVMGPFGPFSLKTKQKHYDHLDRRFLYGGEVYQQYYS